VRAVRDVLQRYFPAHVNIQPDGDVSVWSGEIDDDHRVVFMTNGCGAWRLTY
jgi:hypothetical protein